MTIEKKSLIANRVASKKAIVTKTAGTRVASTKLVAAYVAAKPKLAGIPNTRLTVNTRVAGHTRLALTKVTAN